MDDHQVQVDDKLNDNSSSDQGGKEGPFRKPWSPEKPLVRFVTKLLILRRMSYGIRAMGVFWASTVLLPNLVNVQYGPEFYFVIIILSAEGARIFCLNYDLDWILLSQWTVSAAVKSSCRDLTKKVIRWKSTSISKSRAPGGKTDDKATNPSCSDSEPTTSRMSSNQEDPQLLPDADDSSGRFLNKLIYCLQLLTALICIALSVVRFIQLSIGDAIHPSSGSYIPAAYVFYALAFAQAFFSLLEEIFWEWKIAHCRLLEVVNEESHLGIDAIKNFFYHAYWECDKGKISDGSSFNLFSCASKLLNSDSEGDQLIGIQSLHKLSTDKRSSDHTLQNIGKSMPVIQRLLHMLSWDLYGDAKIRKTAAEIVVKLAGESLNSFRLSAFPGALDNISSMMKHGNKDEFRILGVTIVKKLSDGSINRGDIADSKELVRRLVNTVLDPVLQDHSAEILINLCKNVGVDLFSKLGGVCPTAIKMLKKLMEPDVKEKPLLVELARQLLRHLSVTDTIEGIRVAGEEVTVEFPGTNCKTGAERLTIKLVQILQEYDKAIRELPNRMTPEQRDKVYEPTASTIGLAIETMRKHKPAIATMKRFGMEDELGRIREATSSNMECKKIQKRIDCALKLLAGKETTAADLESE